MYIIINLIYKIIKGYMQCYSYLYFFYVIRNRKKNVTDMTDMTDSRNHPLNMPKSPSYLNVFLGREYDKYDVS
ncbi:uncharacterized protein Dmul_37120 [Desulfococcus multivorans]|nr:uncharacterized protein Dmul_37120 [Desulfococcus multivorans]